MWVGSERSTLCASANEELGTLGDNTPLTGYAPKIFDDNHISETTGIFIQESSSDSRLGMTRRSVTTPSAERSLHHCSLRSEKMQRAVDTLTTLLTKVCRPVSRRLSVIEQGDLLLISLIH